MSASSHENEPKFIGFLKNLFRKLGESMGPRQEPVVPQPAPVPKAAMPSPTAPGGSPPAPQPGSQDYNGVQVPLQAIFAALPVDLRLKVEKAEPGNLTIPVPLETILSQLPQGLVKMPFGEVRKAAPDVFASRTDCDDVWVTLPLCEILPRLNPALLVRRHVQQKPADVPVDITSPFEARGQGMVFSKQSLKRETPVPPPRTDLISVASMSPPRPAITPVLSQPPPKMTPAPPPKPVTPVTPVTPLSPRTATVPAAARTTPIPPPSKPISQPVAPVSPVPPVPPPRAAIVPKPVPAPPVSPPPRPAGESAELSAPLTILAEGWPETVLQEIAQWNLVDARVVLPVDQVESALKRGRIKFAWAVLRSWIRPALLPSVSVHDAVELELPLKIVAPLFLARQTAAKSRPKAAVDETIPNLFFGFPKPETSPAAAVAGPVARPADTNYYVWHDLADSARANGAKTQRKTSPATDFVARYATPNEVVSRAAALDGVAGALIALPDGLMVANRIPADLNGDTLAAFLPQIFSKVSQCTKELRMGELNNLNFTVGNVPWKIFRVNSIFFAAFGRAGEPLPTAQLAALAAVLDRKNK